MEANFVDRFLQDPFKTFFLLDEVEELIKPTIHQSYQHTMGTLVDNLAVSSSENKHYKLICVTKMSLI